MVVFSVVEGPSLQGDVLIHPSKLSRTYTLSVVHYLSSNNLPLVRALAYILFLLLLSQLGPSLLLSFQCQTSSCLMSKESKPTATTLSSQTPSHYIPCLFLATWPQHSSAHDRWMRSQRQSASKGRGCLSLFLVRELYCLSLFLCGATVTTSALTSFINFVLMMERGMFYVLLPTRQPFYLHVQKAYVFLQETEVAEYHTLRGRAMSPPYRRRLLCQASLFSLPNLERIGY